MVRPDQICSLITHGRRSVRVGCGLTWLDLQKLIQEILIAANESNSQRVTGYENQGQMPNMAWVRRFAERNNLTLRATMEISTDGKSGQFLLFIYIYIYILINIGGLEFLC